MNQHRYQLEKYKGMVTRYRCPSCQHRDKTFARYIDTENGQHIAINVGRCNRENGCGYHYTPGEYFKDNNIPFDEPANSYTAVMNRPRQQRTIRKQETAAPPPDPSYFDPALLKATLRAYDQNNFVLYLAKRFGEDTAAHLVSDYLLGTSGKQFQKLDEFPGYVSPKGSVIFWQIDIVGRIRAGQIMLYDTTTGKRVKQPFDHVSWAHATMRLQNFQLKQCFFGEHLLKGNSKPVAIVESCKSAVIASIYFPQFVWLACGTLNGLSTAKCEVLKGRQVILYPDLKAYGKWVSKAEELSYITPMQVSDYLERNASDSERAAGLDIADFLLRYEPADFTTAAMPAPAKEPEANPYEVTAPATLDPGGCTYFFPETYLQGLRLETIYLSDGRIIDTLLTSEGDFITEATDQVKQIEKDYNKHFHVGSLYGHYCLLHCLN